MLAEKVSLQLSSEQVVGDCLACVAGPEESSTSEVVQRLKKFCVACSLPVLVLLRFYGTALCL